METIDRKVCPITGEKNLELLYSFKNFPVFMGCVETSEKEDLKTNMDWYIGKKSGVIQLNPLIPLDKLYAKSHGSGTIGKMWDEHHHNFAKFIHKFKLKNLLEIGSGHGRLIKNYFDLSPESKWTVVEPNPTIENDPRIQIHKKLFDNNFKLDNNIEAIIHSHTIEHLYHPIDLLKNINNKIKKGAYHIFSVPNLKIMLERKYTNALNFEHTLFLDEKLIDEILQITGFEIIKKQFFKEDHSIFYATVKTENRKEEIFTRNYETNKKIYKDYIDFHLDLVNNLNKKIANENTNVYLFGAHVFSQFLINFGLNQNKIKCILDNDEKKQKKRLYGTNLLVKSPKILSDEKKGIVILRSGVYNNEIKNDILKNINKDIIFWE